jgi:hypothetical protein
VLTIKRCREILGADCKLTDEEVEALRDQLYVVAEVTLDAFPSKAKTEADAAGPDTEDGTC